MNATFLWQEKTPPVNTFVWAKYSQLDNWQLVKTCKRGCCVESMIGNMVLPSMWYLATEQEAQAEQEKWDNAPQIDLENLYE